MRLRFWASASILAAVVSTAGLASAHEAMSARADPAAPNTDARAAAAAEFMAAASALHAVLDVCEAQARKASAVHRYLEDSERVGCFRGHPVFLATSASFDAGSLSYGDDRGKQQSAIAVTIGLVQHLAGNLQSTALRFVLAHEAAHLHHGHGTHDPSGSSRVDQLRRDEEQADLTAITDLASHASPDDASLAVELVFSKFEADLEPLPAAIRTMNAARLLRLRAWLADAKDRAEPPGQPGSTLRTRTAGGTSAR
jgi:hypothetical protein